MSSRKLFSIFSNSYTITFSSFDHTIPVPSLGTTKMKITFTGDEFLKALSEDSLQRPLILTGIVKKSEEPSVVLFAPGTFCQNWVPIKSSCIDEVQWLGTVTCKDHSHEYVNIYLKNVNEIEPTLFVDLLKVYVGAYGNSGTNRLVPQSTASLYPTTTQMMGVPSEAFGRGVPGEAFGRGVPSESISVQTMENMSSLAENRCFAPKCPAPYCFPQTGCSTGFLACYNNVRYFCCNGEWLYVYDTSTGACWPCDRQGFVKCGDRKIAI
jgi:hypothetical protein